jgi:hypothetical protein
MQVHTHTIIECSYTYCIDAVALQGLRQSIDRAKLRQQQHQQQQQQLEDDLSSQQQQQQHQQHQTTLSNSAYAVSRAMQHVRTDTAAAAATANTSTNTSNSSTTDDAETPVPSAPLPGSPSDSDHEGEVYGRTGRRSVGVSRVVRRRPSAAAIAAPVAAPAAVEPAVVAPAAASAVPVVVPAASRWAQWTPTSALPYMPSTISSSASTALLPGAATLTGERLRAVHSDLVAVLAAIQQLTDSSSESSRRAAAAATASATASTAASGVYEQGGLSAFVAQLSRPRARHSLSDGAEQAAWQQLKDYDALVRTAAGTPLESRANSIGV